MRTILMLVVGAVVLIGAGVLHVSYNKDTGSATINFDKAKAKERAGQLLGEAKTLEASVEQSAKSKK